MIARLLAINALFASDYVVAGFIPRQAPVVTVTDIKTHTVFAPAVITSTHFVPYTSTSFIYKPAVPSSSVAPGINPINGLPVQPLNTSTTATSTTHRSVSVTPVPYGAYTPPRWTNATSHAPTGHATIDKKSSSKSTHTSLNTISSSERHAPSTTAFVTRQPIPSATSASHTPASSSETSASSTARGNSDGEIGQQPKAHYQSTASAVTSRASSDGPRASTTNCATAYPWPGVC